MSNASQAGAFCVLQHTCIGESTGGNPPRYATTNSISVPLRGPAKATTLHPPCANSTMLIPPLCRIRSRRRTSAKPLPRPPSRSVAVVVYPAVPLSGAHLDASGALCLTRAGSVLKALNDASLNAWPADRRVPGVWVPYDPEYAKHFFD